MKINKFTFDEINNTKFCVYVTGGEQSGKTNLAKEMLNCFRNFDMIYFITSESSYDDELFLFSEKKIIKQNELNVKIFVDIINSVHKKKLIVFDDGIDCLYDLLLENDSMMTNLLECLFTDTNISVIFVSKYFILPELLNCINYMFLTNDDTNVISRHYTKNIFESSDNFVKIYNDVLSKKNIMVIDYDNNTFKVYENDIIVMDCIYCKKLPDKIII